MESTAVPQQGGEKGRAIARPLWLAICEAVVGRRRKATEGLAIIAAANLSAHRVVVASARPGRAAVPGHQPVEPHAPGAEIG